MRERKNSKRMQTVPKKKNNGQTTSRLETPTCTNDEGGEMTASDTDNQENGIHDSPFKPSGTNERRTPMQSVCTKTFDLDDTFVVKL